MAARNAKIARLFTIWFRNRKETFNVCTTVLPCLGDHGSPECNAQVSQVAGVGRKLSGDHRAIKPGPGAPSLLQIH